MSFKRGEVVLILFPDSNLRTAKRRPALVVQADDLASGLPQVIVAMITSNLARGGLRCRVTIQLNTAASQGTGLRTDSVIMADNLATVAHSEVDRNIGALADMSTVDAALRETLSL